MSQRTPCFRVLFTKPFVNASLLCNSCTDLIALSLIFLYHRPYLNMDLWMNMEGVQDSFFPFMSSALISNFINSLTSFVLSFLNFRNILILIYKLTWWVHKGTLCLLFIIFFCFRIYGVIFSSSSGEGVVYIIAVI